MSKQAATWARLIGQGLAQVQDVLDGALTWGFREIKKVGAAPAAKEKETNTYVAAAKKVGRGTLRFLGELGDAYYRRYGELKREKS